MLSSPPLSALCSLWTHCPSLCCPSPPLSALCSLWTHCPSLCCPSPPLSALCSLWSHCPSLCCPSPPLSALCSLWTHCPSLCCPSPPLSAPCSLWTHCPSLCCPHLLCQPCVLCGLTDPVCVVLTSSVSPVFSVDSLTQSVLSLTSSVSPVFSVDSLSQSVLSSPPLSALCSLWTHCPSLCCPHRLCQPCVLCGLTVPVCVVLTSSVSPVFSVDSLSQSVLSSPPLSALCSLWTHCPSLCCPSPPLSALCSLWTHCPSLCCPHLLCQPCVLCGLTVPVCVVLTASVSPVFSVDSLSSLCCPHLLCQPCVLCGLTVPVCVVLTASVSPVFSVDSLSQSVLSSPPLSALCSLWSLCPSLCCPHRLCQPCVLCGLTVPVCVVLTSSVSPVFSVVSLSQSVLSSPPLSALCSLWTHCPSLCCPHLLCQPCVLCGLSVPVCVVLTSSVGPVFSVDSLSQSVLSSPPLSALCSLWTHCPSLCCPHRLCQPCVLCGLTVPVCVVLTASVSPVFSVDSLSQSVLSSPPLSALCSLWTHCPSLCCPHLLCQPCVLCGLTDPVCVVLTSSVSPVFSVDSLSQSVLSLTSSVSPVFSVDSLSQSVLSSPPLSALCSLWTHCPSLCCPHRLCQPCVLCGLTVPVCVVLTSSVSPVFSVDSLSQSVLSSPPLSALCSLWAHCPSLCCPHLLCQPCVLCGLTVPVCVVLTASVSPVFSVGSLHFRTSARSFTLYLPRPISSHPSDDFQNTPAHNQ